ncbi:hypothetical protein [Aeromonas sp. MR7]|uniref:hypothetical protein n=1 Tax=Aeromonas sp. MR7 TaxID=2923419 RepID=UPI001F4A0B86|nr:hypothetical protein [Aeromonas sp. MR7]MCH7350105.1 hypothetical protein [Aeromonas sp. MR7]
MENIYLNLDTSEFDEFNLQTKDLWQQDAASQLIKHLTTLGNAAKKIKECTCHPKGSATRHVHDAILISGGRGTGKSIFLYNSKTLWDEQSNKEPNKPNIKFLDPIDPTLLQDNDSFSNVIIANIYNCVHETIQGKPQKESQKFYDCLRKLAESIEDVDKQQLGGLDKLMHYSSGIRVQDNFYHFVKEAITLLGCDALVLPIDDVDMALGKAYDVLEEIRRRLCCPFIIPLVSGDPDLYEHLVKINFGKSIVNKDLKEIKSTEDTEQKNNNSPEKRLLDNLPNAYLTKVLPHHYRITLQSIDAITSRLEIKWNGNYGIPYARQSIDDTYQDRLLSFFFGPKHDDEKGRDFPWPKSSRELGQMVRLLRPDDLQSTTESDKYRNLLEALKTWSSACQHGACYTLALSTLEFKAACRASQLTVFNLNKQANLNIPWAKYNFTKDQINTIKNYTNIDGVLKANQLLIEHSLRSNILRSMPPIELHLDKMSVTKAEADNESPFLLAIYTYNSYYGTQGNKQLKIYFSRAIELLFTSILNASKDEADNKPIYKEILEQAPFYSVYNLNPTKQVEEEVSYEPDEESVDTNFNNENKTLISKIVAWDHEYAELVNQAFANRSQAISLLSAVFNKTFTQIGYLRKSFKTIKTSREDELIDLALRFKYITLNSFGFFLKENGIRVTSNIAIETKVETLRNATRFKQSSNTYRENIGWIYSSDSTEAKLIDAISKHPIFVQLNDLKTLQNTSIFIAPPILKEDDEKNKKRLRRIRTKISKEINDKFSSFFKNTKYDTPNKLIKYIFEVDAFSDPIVLKKAMDLLSSLKIISKRIEFLSDRHPLKKLYISLTEKFTGIV